MAFVLIGDGVDLVMSSIVEVASVAEVYIQHRVRSLQFREVSDAL